MGFEEPLGDTLGVEQLGQPQGEALMIVDERWQYYTAGVGGVARAPFDGFVPHSRSAYPGTTLSDFTTNVRVPGANHINLITVDDGIIALAGAMLQRQMRLPQ